MTPKPTLASLAIDLASGRASSRSLVEACLDRIEDPAGEGSKTFLLIDKRAVLAHADAMDLLRSSGAAPSRYAGIPISVKDLFDVSGQVTRAGSTALQARPAATRDAPCIARLRRAGFVLIGRTNMTEFAFSGIGMNPHYGTPRNPWERAQARVPGGSSSGAAISVTDLMAHAAIGTDTGGSCRIPAALTGLVGYKPTARRVPLAGAFQLSTSLDSIGPLARSVACCASLDAVLAGETPPDLSNRSVSGLRFAIPKTTVLENFDTHVAAQFERCLARLEAAGARLEYIDMPEFGRLGAINSKGGLAAAECFAWHRELLQSHAAEYDPRVLTRIQKGATQSAADYIDLLNARKAYIAGVEERIARFDALLMPTTPIVAPRIADLEDDSEFFRCNALMLRNPATINFLDGCAISIPIHGDGEPPTGLMLACRGGADAHLFQCAAAAESVVCS